MKARLICLLFLLPLPRALGAEETLGYYRFPALHGDTLVFSAEGDLWRVGRQGGTATRLTTHPAEETVPAISPDGRTIAFSAAYEGPNEVYTMPIDGGLPVRRTFEGGDARVVSWTPGGEILYTTRHWSGLPANQLLRLDPATGRSVLLPLAQAADGDYTPDGKTLFFTRFAFQGSHTKRYQGGTAQSLWRYREGDAEATALTADFTGTSREPMVWQGRLYFVSDRDGTLNLWSMDEDGHDLRQLTTHRGWDVASPSLSEGRIVYQLGADLRLYDVAAGKDEPIPIRLVSDFDQMRETWVQSPMEYLTAFDLSPSGDRVALTARGEVFVAPVKKGRLVEVTRKPGVRYREARFLPDSKSVLALSDESGEVELWKLPANGVGKPEPLTNDGKVLRWEALPSPDGKWIAHRDKDRQLWLLNVKTRKNSRIAVSVHSDFQDLDWSPDGRWLAWAASGANTFQRIEIYDTVTGHTVPVTSDRFNSWSPTWSSDGKWLWFLSDRELRTLVQGPWGPRQPDPFLTATTKIFGAALKKGLRSPFQPPDELHGEDKGEDDKDVKPEKPEKEGKAEKGKGDKRDKGDRAAADEEKPPKVAIDLDGLAERLVEVPVEAGNYDSLAANEERLYWLESDPSFEEEPSSSLMTIAFSRDKPETKTVAEGITDYQLSEDGKKLAVRKAKALYVFAAGDDSPDDLDTVKVDLSGWTFPLDPKEQWRQMFREAWRLERDYFYDPRMHGVDWPAMLEKYRPLSLRVTSRAELNDLLGQMVSELSALHTFVHGGDRRKGDTDVEVASLGAVLARDEKGGGYRVERIYRWDPDLPASAPPLAALGVEVKVGDVVEAINGVSVLSVPDAGLLLRNQAEKQVLLRLHDGKTRAARDVVAVPVNPKQADDLRYTDWELSRRKAVEEKGRGQIGYLHLRAMDSDDYTSWAMDFYPVFDRPGLILDLRNNRGGNIESWLLDKLQRKAWFWWQPRVGSPSPNMQYAFRGHLVVLVNENTSSDGEAFAEGVKRLGLGKVIGTRTWGGEIWLSSSNLLVDKGIATAAEFGVFGPDGTWLIEGHGVDPDVVVDNLPHATFLGCDAQLDTALAYLQDEIQKHPMPPVKAPEYPNKSLRP